MVNGLKTYGGMAFHFIENKFTYLRTIVAVTSDKQASELLGDSLWGIRYYWAETEDADEETVTTAHPGIVFIRRDGKYIPLADRGDGQ